MDAGNSNIWLKKGNELFELNEYQKAMEFYERSIRVCP